MAAAVVPSISIEEYLRTAYRPDMDFVDGVLEDRNVGEFDHFMVQRALLFALASGEEAGGYLTAQELRVQVSPSRFRVPDTCLLPADKLPQRVVTEPPMLCIEVLSPEDTFARIRSRCKDYLAMGVPAVWILDPESRTAFVMQGDTTTEHQGGVLRLQGTSIELSLDAIFAKLNR